MQRPFKPRLPEARQRGMPTRHPVYYVETLGKLKASGGRRLGRRV